MSFYTNLRATAQRLIAAKGLDATLTKRTAGAYSAANLGAATVTSTSYAVKAVRTNYNEDDYASTLVLRGDKRMIVGCEGLSVRPAKDDLMTIEGVDHLVMSVKAIEPGPTAVVFIVQCRQS